MSLSNSIFSAIIVALLLLQTACTKDKTIITISPGDNAATEIQEALITMENGMELHLEAGTYTFNNTLSIEGKDSIKIIGAGKDLTILNFAGQLAGGEGVLASNCNGLLFQDLKVEDAVGDALKTKDCSYVSFVNVGTVWTGEPDSTNGAYGLYPVLCSYVYIDGCYAYGASDAGIYVGQSNSVILKNSIAEGNVAGIEIENTIGADVYDNEAFDNTGGILVFDLPGLTMYGSNCRVYNNNCHDNNRDNFAPAGNVVGNVPAGTGVMLLATHDVEIFGNTLSNNNFANVIMASYDLIDSNHGDTDFVAFYYNIGVYGNTYAIDSTQLNLTGQPDLALDIIGLLDAYGYAQPDILIDGASFGNLCISDTTASFVNVNAPADPTNFSGINSDFSALNCSGVSLDPISFSPYGVE